VDTSIKREAEILNDEIIERHRLPEIQPDGKITTPDLAGGKHVAPAVPMSLDVEPVTGLPTDNNCSRRTEIVDGAVFETSVQAGASRGTAAAVAPALAQETGQLFSGNEANELRAKWDAIQVGFVDEPRGAVAQAEALVAGTMKRLAEVFAAERSKLDGQWNQGENVSTEDLRLALRRYRSFFGRLLSV